MDILKERVKCSNGTNVECNVIEARLYYDLGGYNYATYQPKKRGYYISVSPLKVDGCWTSYMGFTGGYLLLKECSRKSKKSEDEAKELFHQKKDSLIKRICDEHGITLL